MLNNYVFTKVNIKLSVLLTFSFYLSKEYENDYL